MCNIFDQLGKESTSTKAIAQELVAQLKLDFDLSREVLPGSMAIALATNRQGLREMIPMRFGMIQPWESKRPYTNARAENLDGRAWSTPAMKWRCVVPMRSFREPCYWNETTEGKEVDFSSINDSLMMAAAIFRFREVVPDSYESSMALVMRPALPYVMENGHHRSPFFLSADGVDEWMRRGEITTDRARKILKENATEPELTHAVARQMKDGWKSRVSANLKKRDNELTAIDQAGSLGI